MQAHHSAWTTCLFAGDPAATCAHCDVGRRLYDPERHRSHRLLYGGHDPGVCVDFIGGQAHWALGYPEKGLALGRAALASAERIAHPFSLASALLFNGVLFLEVATRRRHCNYSTRPRRSLPSNDLGWSWNLALYEVPH